MKQIWIKNLFKCYGKNVIINNYSGILTSENIYFLISENGSGKTTFFKCLLKETKYQGIVLDSNLIYAFMPERVLFPYLVTVIDYLSMFLEHEINHYFTQIIDDFLELFEIKKYKNEYINRLSKGTKQKVLIIKTLLSSADVYLFDEPLSGLDQKSRNVFMSLVKSLQESDKIIIIASHYYYEYPFDNKKVIDICEFNKNT